MSEYEDVIVPQIRKQGRTRFDFLGGCLPDGCEPTDIDNLIEHKGRFLVFEYKQPGEDMPRGQERALQALLELNRNAVTIIQCEGIPPTEIHRYRWLAVDGEWQPREWMVGNEYVVRELARHWWNWAHA